MGFDEGEESKARKDSIGMYRNGYMDGNRGIYIRRGLRRIRPVQKGLPGEQMRKANEQ